MHVLRGKRRYSTRVRARRGLLGRAAVTIAAIMATHLVGTPAAHSSHLPPTRLAVFNTPTSGLGTSGPGDDVAVPGAPSKITESIVALINAASPSATIRIAIFEFTDGLIGANELDEVDQIITALRLAMQRGVTVMGVAEEKKRAPGDPWAQLTAPYTVAPDVVIPPATVYNCEDGCYNSSNSIAKMHNKFMLIDDTVWSPNNEYVVVQMTANWTNRQLRDTYWNSMVQIWGDHALFAGYRTYWDGLRACVASACPTSYPDQSFQDDLGGVTAQVSPQSSGDPQKSQLSYINCGPLVPTVVDVAMAGWTNISRGQEIADSLSQLSADGCPVRIVVSRDSDILPYLLEKEFSLPPHCTDTSGTDLDIDPVAGGVTPALHSKYVLVNGTYGSQPLTRAVFMGSTNYTGPALTVNDEVWLKLASVGASFPENAGLYAQFSADFSSMWSQTLPCELLPENNP
jgi:phosphatidylserine/phosphatidylglycerophosphate/cardiolipin synthase-like enzyme